MLTGTDQGTASLATVAPHGALDATGEVVKRGIAAGAGRSRLARALRVEWLGQTVASVCWIASVLAYGIGSTGDWLQLMAASAWLIANIAAAATTRAN